MAVLFPAQAAAQRPPHRPIRRFGAAQFPQGVLSGDPTTDGITLVTFLGGVQGFGTVRLEIARDPGFRRLITTQDVPTGPATGFSVKVRATGLEPRTRYWYRFETRHSHSPVGRFQTALPADSHETVRFACFSCANFAHGFYNAYDAMAREDLDFVVSLGDYIYAEARHSLATGGAVRDDLVGSESMRQGVLREAITLADYRAKYALYRSDPALRRMHAAFPTIAIWDDHELENNYAGRPADGGLGQRYQYSAARRAASYQAFFEAMPVEPRGRSRIYRSLRHGRAVELAVLDERQYRADQPCGGRRVQACASWGRTRPFLGRRQLDWAVDTVTGSTATWKVIGTQSMTMPVLLAEGRYGGFDSWQGYPVEREELLSRIAGSGTRDVVFMAGDAHIFLAGDVRRQMGAGESVAVEFVAGSISSGGMGEGGVDLGDGHVFAGDDQNPHSTPEVLPVLRGYNPWIQQGDIDHHGYVSVTATPKTFDVEMRRMATVKRPSRIVLPSDGYRWTLHRGETSLGGASLTS
ncbi:MAG: alkaline phosphatase [Solirubrobacteraceae bacterium]|nr:alkaline phosphatase [Solirubrobacteraceae bacterium]